MIPKALILLFVLTLGVSAAIIPETPQAEGANSVRASCVPGCQCRKRFNGLECNGNYIYQCGPNGECCNWGYRDSCARCGNLKCPPTPTPTPTL